MHGEHPRGFAITVHGISVDASHCHSQRLMPSLGKHKLRTLEVVYFVLGGRVHVQTLSGDTLRKATSSSNKQALSPPRACLRSRSSEPGLRLTSFEPRRAKTSSKKLARSALPDSILPRRE